MQSLCPVGCLSLAVYSLARNPGPRTLEDITQVWAVSNKITCRLLVIWNQYNHHSFIHSTYPTREGKPLAWDFTVVDIVCPTAEKAKLRKIHRYRQSTPHGFPLHSYRSRDSGAFPVQFLEDLWNKISNINVERRYKSFPFQSIGIAIQRGNALWEQLDHSENWRN